MSAPSRLRHGFRKWLTRVLPDAPSTGAVAFILNLYEGAETFDAQIAAASHFDPDNREWAVDTILSSGEDLFSFRRAVVDNSWQRALRLYADLLADYLATGCRRDMLTEAEGVGVGFVDGDVVLVHPPPQTERVHAVFDYYDGPRHGVADFHGRPHTFLCEFDNDLRDWSEFYHLKALTDEQFRLVMTDWEIWTRWLAAHKAGLVDVATHPALPGDATLHEQIETAVNDALSVDTTTAKMVFPTFHGRLPPDGELQVAWSLVSG
jgi:hypothetical protein